MYTRTITDGHEDDESKEKPAPVRRAINRARTLKKRGPRAVNTVTDDEELEKQAQILDAEKFVEIFKSA
jgi:hypothetical protein